MGLVLSVQYTLPQLIFLKGFFVMKIDFKPQKLVNNIVTEHFTENGTALNRIISIPAKNQRPERVLDITYKKSNILPTEWYVSNYNLFSRNGKNVVHKTLTSEKNLNKTHTVVTTYGTCGYGRQVTINTANNNVSKSEKPIKI